MFIHYPVYMQMTQINQNDPQSSSSSSSSPSSSSTSPSSSTSSSSSTFIIHQQTSKAGLILFFITSLMSGDCQHAYFKRTEVFEKRLHTARNSNYKYELIGVAKNTTLGIDIYCCYFHSPFNRHYHDVCARESVKYLEKVDASHISFFFLAFLEVLVLRACICLNERISSTITSLVNDLFGAQYAPLEAWTKLKIQDLFDQSYKRFFRSDPHEYDFKTQFNEVNQEIREILHNKFAYVDQNIEGIAEKEFLPAQSLQFLKMYIKYNFEKILNIHVMRKSLKKDVLAQFESMVKRHSFIKIEFLMETRTEEDKKVNAIFLPKLTKEAYPVLKELYNFLQDAERSAFENAKKQFNDILLDYMKKVVELCYKYHQNTKKVYPNISIHDFRIDYKNLLPFLSHNALILDGIGFRGQTKNIELRLSTEPTPESCVQMCHLEKEQEWAFVRKFYYLENQSKLKQSEKEDAEVEYGSPQSVSSEEQILESSHVWRLISILYEIGTLKHLTHAMYLRYSEDKSFTAADVLKVAKRIFLDLQNGNLKLSHIFKPFPFFLQSQTQNSEFQFKMQTMGSIFKLESQEDSLLADLRFRNTLEYLNARSDFGQEIVHVILFKKGFKKLINAKKYIISFFINAIEELHFQIMLRDPSETEEFRELIEQYLREQNFYKQFDKRSAAMRAVSQKLNDYSARNDVNGKFLISSRYGSIVQQAYAAITQIYSLYSLQATLEQSEQNSSNPREEIRNILNQIKVEDTFINDDIAILSRNIDNLEYSVQHLVREACKVYNQAIFTKSKQAFLRTREILIAFTNQQLNPSLRDPSTLHSFADLGLKNPVEKQVFEYINCKLVILIDIYMSLSLSNFRQALTIYSSNGFDILRKGAGVNTSISSREIKQKLANLEVYKTYFTRDLPQMFFRDNRELPSAIPD